MSTNYAGAVEGEQTESPCIGVSSFIIRPIFITHEISNNNTDYNHVVINLTLLTPTITTTMETIIHRAYVIFFILLYYNNNILFYYHKSSSVIIIIIHLLLVAIIHIIYDDDIIIIKITKNNK